MSRVVTPVHCTEVVSDSVEFDVRDHVTLKQCAYLMY